MTRGFNQIPFGTTGRPGLNAGDYSSLGTYTVNGTKGVCAYRLGLKTDICHKGRVSASGGVLGLTAQMPGCCLRSEHRFRLVLSLTAWSETTEAAVTRS